MLVMLAAHIIATMALTLQNRAARKAYECNATIQASKSSRTMILSGLTILAFVDLSHAAFHRPRRRRIGYNTLDRYKTKLPRRRRRSPQRLADGHRRLLVWWRLGIFYVIAMTLLCSHLIHGVGSIFQTLGLRSKKAASLIQQISIGYGLFIWLGFISIPVAILSSAFGR